LDTSRRRFAAALGGFTLGGLTRLGWPPRRASVRPPGALAEARFAGVCVRCGNCISHCPAGILRPDTDPVGLFGLAAPVVRFGPDYCREDCNRCGQVCPTGAIRALDLPAKRQAVMGVAVIKREHCVCWVKEEQCMACADVCPYDAVRTVPSRTVDFPSVRIEACLGCGACEIACPAATLAIVVEPPDGVSGPPAR
jgi:ferredoxin